MNLTANAPPKGLFCYLFHSFEEPVVNTSGERWRGPLLVYALLLARARNSVEGLTGARRRNERVALG
jgi:hypothetical protein